MTESLDVPCVLFALRREALPFRRRLRLRRRYADAPCWAGLCGHPEGPVLVLETGIGLQCTLGALDWLLRSARVQVIVSAGFGGALRDGFQVGDILLATEVTDAVGRCWGTTWPGARLPRQGGPHLHRGRLLTMSRMVANPLEKRDLGNRHGAAVVDMEGAAVAERCTTAGVPFGCVRTVSDNVHAALAPQLAFLLSGGRVSAVRLLAALSRSPWLLGELGRMARQTRLAARQLAVALAMLLLPGNLSE